MGPAAPKRQSAASRFALRCGCRDSKSVSVSDASAKSTATPRTKSRSYLYSSADTQTLTLTSAASTSSFFDDDDDDDEKLESLATTPSFSELLLQLNELEQGVMELGKRTKSEGEKKNRRHRRSSSGRVEESVPVVKESEDPLGDFRKSMLQMIVEKEIVTGEELRELLRKFLDLNSPLHHDVILKAFAEIWVDVFAGYEATPDLLRGKYRPENKCK
ncbi:uncharacterized protein [Typha angustifolia]|uniref:uncharacterized protein n=1 Tax=Typha angustifolia TaxID=59011 RepID=UPI003C2F5FCA